MIGHPNKQTKITIKYIEKLSSVHCVQNVPINMGVKWRLLYRLYSMRDYFVSTILYKFNFISLEISEKRGLSFDFDIQHSKVFSSDSSLFKISRTVLISVIFKDTKKVDGISKTSKYFDFFICISCHLSIIINQKRYSCPCFFGTPCTENYNNKN